MKKLRFAIATGVILASTAVSASVQMGPGYKGIAFVDAVKNHDNDKALDALGDNPAPAIVNTRNGDGDTALIIAVGRQDVEWTGFLLNKGADPELAAEKSGDTPLIIAARLGFNQGVEWLIQMGAKVDATNKLGETALIAAVEQRQTRAVRMLLEAGADPDRTDTAAGYSAREYAERDSRARDILNMINAKKPKPTAR